MRRCLRDVTRASLGVVLILALLRGAVGNTTWLTVAE